MRVSTTHPCLHLLHIYLQNCHQKTEKCPHKTSLSAYYVLFIRWNVLVVIGHQTKEKNCLSDFTCNQSVLIFWFRNCFYVLSVIKHVFPNGIIKQ